MCTFHNPIECIIPPYMLEQVLERGDAKVRAAALRAVKLSNHLRQQRNAFLERPIAVAKAMTAGVDAHSAQLVRRVHNAQNGDELPGALARA